MNRNRLKRSLLLSAVMLIIAATAMLRITAHSNIRNVELVTIFACGCMFGVFFLNLVLFLSSKKQNL